MDIFFNFECTQDKLVHTEAYEDENYLCLMSILKLNYEFFFRKVNIFIKMIREVPDRKILNPLEC
jgi:hypothetical protein